jgi:hypothetical protein
MMSRQNQRIKSKLSKFTGSPQPVGKDFETCARLVGLINSRTMTIIHKHTILLIGLIVCLATVSVHAQPANGVGTSGIASRLGSERVGQLGDPAPPLTVAEWIKGGPVKIQPGTNIYVLVFCTLSKANEFAITNLSSLQRKYQDKGLITVVISDDPPEQLRNFVQANGGKIDFTVAADDLARRTTTFYQKMFEQMLLPRGYIVGKDGTVLWYGHPLRDDMGLVVDEIASGQFNLEQTRKKVIARGQMDEYLMLVRQGDPVAARAGRLLLRIRTNDAPALCDLAFQIATAPYIEKRDAALANTALDRAEQLSSTNAIDTAVDRAILLFQTGQQQAGLALAKKTLATARTDADKSEVQTTIHAMEARLAAAKAQASSINGPTNVPAGNP